MKSSGASKTPPAHDPSYVDVAGPRDAPPVVFAHGIGVTRKQWLPQMRDLADAYRVITTDLPGHGALAATRFSLDAATAHLDRVIDEVAGEPALVVGISLGGYVAMELAQSNPGRLAGLVLTGCSANPRGVLAIIPPTVALFNRAVGSRWLSLVNQVNFRARYGEAIAQEQIKAGTFFKATQDALMQLSRKDFRGKLRAYPGPVLFLNGERDTLFRLGELNFLAAARDARLQLVRGAGHVANLEEPEAYNRALRSFARSIEWQPSAG